VSRHGRTRLQPPGEVSPSSPAPGSPRGERPRRSRRRSRSGAGRQNR
jgi:hypothetical protein